MPKIKFINVVAKNIDLCLDLNANSWWLSDRQDIIKLQMTVLWSGHIMYSNAL